MPEERRARRGGGARRAGPAAAGGGGGRSARSASAWDMGTAFPGAGGASMGEGPAAGEAAA